MHLLGIVGIVVAVLVCLALIGFGVVFMVRQNAESVTASSTKPILFYKPRKGDQVEPSEVYDSYGIPRGLVINEKVQVYLYGSGHVRAKELMEVIRRYLLIPVDNSRNPSADPKQTFLMHPKKYAIRLKELVSDPNEVEFLRNLTLAVLIERCVVQTHKPYAEMIRTLLEPVAGLVPEIGDLFLQLAKTPQSQAKNAELLMVAFKSQSRRTRFIAASSVSMLVFTRDNAPIALKVVELVKKLDIYEGLLSAHDVDPTCFGTFERAVRVRAPMGRPIPDPRDIANEAVKKGHGAAVSACLLTPLQYPLPEPCVPAACIGDLLMAARQYGFLVPIVDATLSMAAKSPSAKPSYLAIMDRLLSKLEDKQLPLTGAALALRQGELQGVELSHAEETMVAAAESRIEQCSPISFDESEGEAGAGAVEGTAILIEEGEEAVLGEDAEEGAVEREGVKQDQDQVKVEEPVVANDTPAVVESPAVEAPIEAPAEPEAKADEAPVEN